MPPEVFVEICSSLESTRTPPCVGPEGGTKHPTPEERQSGRDRSLKRRRRDEEGAPSAPGSSTYGLDPVVVQSAKPWPVFTIGSSFPAQTEQHLSEADRYGKKNCPPPKAVVTRVPVHTQPSCGTQAEESTGEDGRPAVQPCQGDGQAGAGWSGRSVGGGGCSLQTGVHVFLL